MSGVQCGSRLDRLLNLRRATTLQHTLAQRAQDHAQTTRLALLLEHINTAIRHEAESIAADARRRPTIAAGVRRTDETVEEHLRRIGTSTRTVKEWAVGQGLLPAVVRGRVSAALVNAYETAHQHQETPQ